MCGILSGEDSVDEDVRLLGQGDGVEVGEAEADLLPGHDELLLEQAELLGPRQRGVRVYGDDRIGEMADEPDLRLQLLVDGVPIGRAVFQFLKMFQSN